MNAAPVSKPRLRTSLAFSTLPLLLLFFTLLNGYALNLVGGYQANPWVVLAGVVLEAALTLIAARRFVAIDLDGSEAAGFGLVVLGVWFYFILPSLPTLLPPTQSVDAVRHYLQASFSYPKGTLVSWYPAGGAFIVAMLSSWLSVQPLYMLHPVAALFVALSAGATYGITCDLLPPTRLSRLAALAAPALLFVPWSYFAGSINWEQYFFAQVAAQYFVIVALWYLVTYAGAPRGIFLILFVAALLGIVAAYPYLVALPLGVLALVLTARLVAGDRSGDGLRRVFVVLAILAALLVLVAMALQQGGILEFGTFRIATEGDVGEGGVTNPSLDMLGGPILLVLALAGALRAWNAGARGRTLVGFVVVWLLQLVALFLIQPLLQISGYRVDKTFYILIYPLAILAALALSWLAEHWKALDAFAARRAFSSLLVAALVLMMAVLVFRPPVFYTPLTPSELATALWAKDHLETNRVNALAMDTTQAYWIAVGLWREMLPNEYFQWIPKGSKLGPAKFEDWMNDSAWSDYLLVRDTTHLPSPLPAAVYQNGVSAILYKPTPISAAPNPSKAEVWKFENYARLIGYDVARLTYRPGETLEFATYTESLSTPYATLGWRAELVDRTGNVVSKATADPFGAKYPLQRWPPGRFSVDRWSLPLDSTLAPGQYHLQLGLYSRTSGNPVRAFPPSGYRQDIDYSTASIADIKVPVVPPMASELSAAKSLGAVFGDGLTLAKYALDSDRTTRTVHLVLYWSALKPTQSDYTIFVHLLDSGGSVIAQKDTGPRDGSYPTSIWDAGETVSTDYAFSIPDSVPWPASIEIGMYTLPDLRRLPTGNSDHVVLPLSP